ncbi:hypothetical protein HY639_00150 [Candidatus Woesearchaeota archaeon]|nr:hypothetical protein [Candidatus Woesearchaeota archaeon]
MNTLLVYNDTKVMERFIHFLVNKLRLFKMRGLIMVIDERKAAKILPILTQFCDKCVKI